MALFQLENRKYYVDEESLTCFRVDDLAYKGLELWIGSGHTMTLEELETQLLEDLTTKHLLQSAAKICPE